MLRGQIAPEERCHQLMFLWSLVWRWYGCPILRIPEWEWFYRESDFSIDIKSIAEVRLCQWRMTSAYFWGMRKFLRPQSFHRPCPWTGSGQPWHWRTALDDRPLQLLAQTSPPETFSQPARLLLSGTRPPAAYIWQVFFARILSVRRRRKWSSKSWNSCVDLPASAPERTSRGHPLRRQWRQGPRPKRKPATRHHTL